MHTKPGAVRILKIAHEYQIIYLNSHLRNFSFVPEYYFKKINLSLVNRFISKPNSIAIYYLIKTS